MRIGSIGLGNMSGAILRGVINNGFMSPENICGYDIDTDKLRAFAEDTGIKALASNADVAAQSDVVLLAVKPNDFPAMLASISDGILRKKPLLLSIATGTSIASLKEWLGDDAGEVPIVRIIRDLEILAKS